MKYLPDDEIRDIWDDYTKNPTVEKQNLIFNQYYRTIQKVAYSQCKVYNVPVTEYDDIINELSLKFLERLKLFKKDKAPQPGKYVKLILRRLCYGLIMREKYRAKNGTACRISRVLSYISKTKEETGKQPTLEEIRDNTGIKIDSIKNYITDAGYYRNIEHDCHNRGLEIVDTFDEFEYMLNNTKAKNYLLARLMDIVYNDNGNSVQDLTNEQGNLRSFLEKRGIKKIKVRYVTDDKKQQIIKEFQDGLTLQKIVKKLKTSKETIKRVLVEAGLDISRAQPYRIEEEKINTLYEKLKQGTKPYRIALELGLSQDRVHYYWKRLKSQNPNIVTEIENRKKMQVLELANQNKSMSEIHSVTGYSKRYINSTLKKLKNDRLKETERT